MSQVDNQAKWMRQWRRAAIALAEVRQWGLAQMSDAAALAAAERVLAPLVVSEPPRSALSSGLVEQQRLFRRGR
jgi:hypothetical protein